MSRFGRRWFARSVFVCAGFVLAGFFGWKAVAVVLGGVLLLLGAGVVLSTLVEWAIE